MLHFHAINRDKDIKWALNPAFEKESPKNDYDWEELQSDGITLMDSTRKCEFALEKNA